MLTRRPPRRSPRRSPAAAALLALLLIPGALTPVAFASDKPRTPPPVKPAADYPLHEAHPTEHVTVAADPCTSVEACPNFRLQYVRHGFLPIRVIITNDRDQPLVLDDVRMQFLPGEGDKEPAANYEDLNRRFFNKRSTEPVRIPLIPLTFKKEPIDTKILNDDHDFGFTSTTVAPHSTVAGYVFYDMQPIDVYDPKDMEIPEMQHAELNIKQIHSTDGKGKAVELFAFTLPLDTWLKAQPAPTPKPKDASPRDHS